MKSFRIVFTFGGTVRSHGSILNQILRPTYSFPQRLKSVRIISFAFLLDGSMSKEASPSASNVFRAGGGIATLPASRSGDPVCTKDVIPPWPSRNALWEAGFANLLQPAQMPGARSPDVTLRLGLVEPCALAPRVPQRADE